MGCLLTEFKLTAMLFGGERRKEVVWFGCRCFFGGFVPFALSTSPPSISLLTGEVGGKKNTFQGRTSSVRWSADGFC